MRARLLALALVLSGLSGVLIGACTDRAPAEPVDKPALADGGPDDVHHGPASVSCANCHAEDDRTHVRWKELAVSVGHDVDSVMEQRGSCTCCHLGEIEGFGDPIAERCNQCHDQIHVTIPKMGSAHCLACHDFAQKTNLRESGWECLRCHAEEQKTSDEVTAAEPATAVKAAG